MATTILTDTFDVLTNWTAPNGSNSGASITASGHTGNGMLVTGWGITTLPQKAINMTVDVWVFWTGALNTGTGNTILNTYNGPNGTGNILFSVVKNSNQSIQLQDPSLNTIGPTAANQVVAGTWTHLVWNCVVDGSQGGQSLTWNGTTILSNFTHNILQSAYPPDMRIASLGLWNSVATSATWDDMTVTSPENPGGFLARTSTRVLILPNPQARLARSAVRVAIARVPNISIPVSGATGALTLSGSGSVQQVISLSGGSSAMTLDGSGTAVAQTVVALSGGSSALTFNGHGTAIVVPPLSLSGSGSLTLMAMDGLATVDDGNTPATGGAYGLGAYGAGRYGLGQNVAVGIEEMILVGGPLDGEVQVVEGVVDVGETMTFSLDNYQTFAPDGHTVVAQGRILTYKVRGPGPPPDPNVDNWSVSWYLDFVAETFVVPPPFLPQPPVVEESLLVSMVASTGLTIDGLDSPGVIMAGHTHLWASGQAYGVAVANVTMAGVSVMTVNAQDNRNTTVTMTGTANLNWSPE